MLVLMKGFQVTKSSLVPAVVTGRDELVRANSRLTLAGVFGGAVAGLVAVGVLEAHRCERACSCAVRARVRARGATRRERPDGGRAARSRRAASDGRRAHRTSPRSGCRSIAMAVLRGGVGFLTFLLAFALKREGEPAWFYGLVIVDELARWTRRSHRRATAATSASARRRCSSCRSPSRRRPPCWGPGRRARPAALIVAFALGLGASAGRAGFDSLVQRDAPDTLWGRSFARYEAYFQLAWVLGAADPRGRVDLAGDRADRPRARPRCRRVRLSRGPGRRQPRRASAR